MLTKTPKKIHYIRSSYISQLTKQLISEPCYLAMMLYTKAYTVFVFVFHNHTCHLCIHYVLRLARLCASVTHGYLTCPPASSWIYQGRATMHPTHLACHTRISTADPKYCRLSGLSRPTHGFC